MAAPAGAGDPIEEDQSAESLWQLNKAMVEGDFKRLKQLLDHESNMSALGDYYSRPIPYDVMKLLKDVVRKTWSYVSTLQVIFHGAMKFVAYDSGEVRFALQYSLPSTIEKGTTFSDRF